MARAKATKRKPARGTAREREIKIEIATLESVVVEARAAGSYTPAVSAMTRIGTLRGDLARHRSQAAIEKEPDPVKRIQLQRQLALADGSHVAAAKLAQVEASLLAALAHETTEQARVEMTDLPADALVAILVESIASLPVSDVEAIATACRERMLAAGIDEDDDER